MIQKFIKNLPDAKKSKLVQILSNQRSSTNVEQNNEVAPVSDKQNEYRFTIDTFEDKVHFTKKIASSRSPKIPGTFSEDKSILNADSTREYLSLQKSLGISDMSNQNIRILDDDFVNNKTSKIQKPKLAGAHNVHFTPKAPLPNTILGLYEDKIDIN